MNPLLVPIRSVLVRCPARIWLLGFAIALAADLVAITFGADDARWVSKPALMLLLLGFLTVSVEPGRAVTWVLGSGLGLAWAADIALLIDGTAAFLIGMALFGLMQIAYLTVFTKLGALEPLRRRWAVPACYLAFWLGANIVLFPRLEALAVPIAVYSLLLVTMGAAASGLGLVTAVGGALFVASDLMLGLGVAGLDFALRDQAVMATYGAAQLLIVLGCIRRIAATRSSRSRVARPRRKTAA